MSPEADQIFVSRVQSALDILGVNTGALLGGTWRFSDSISMADPGAGRFRYNHGTLGSVTDIAISATTRPGFDASTILGALALNDRLYIQEEKEAGSFQVWNISSVVDNTTWFQITVTSVALGTIPANNKDCVVGAIFT